MSGGSVQTFLPMKSYRASLESLDPVRLNKQILECAQMIEAILDPARGYQNHPAVRMWRRHEKALCTYGVSACVVRDDERVVWFNNKIRELGAVRGIRRDSIIIPPWMGDLDLHRSHRSRLMEKDPEFYNWEGTPENMPYLWPVNESDGYRLFLSGADLKRMKADERQLPEWLTFDPDTGEVFEQ